MDFAYIVSVFWRLVNRNRKYASSAKSGESTTFDAEFDEFNKICDWAEDDSTYLITKHDNIVIKGVIRRQMKNTCFVHGVVVFYHYWSLLHGGTGGMLNLPDFICSTNHRQLMLAIDKGKGYSAIDFLNEICVGDLHTYYVNDHEQEHEYLMQILKEKGPALVYHFCMDQKFYDGGVSFGRDEFHDSKQYVGQLCMVLIVLELVCASWTPSDALQQHREIHSVAMLEDMGKWKTSMESGKQQIEDIIPKKDIKNFTRNKDIISRDPKVVVTSDARGNLGPASVIVQNPPGSDWIKDRWQAASDMGGTAIPGAHWVMLDFDSPVVATSIVLDWEAAHADNYRIELRNKLDDDDAGWTVIFDGSNPHDCEYRSVKKSGQSPGVKYEMPLHVVHKIELTELEPQVKDMVFRYLRVFIVKPAAGWGVSLWQVDVYGRKA